MQCLCFAVCLNKGIFGRAPLAEWDHGQDTKRCDDPWWNRTAATKATNGWACQARNDMRSCVLPAMETHPSLKQRGCERDCGWNGRAWCGCAWRGCTWWRRICMHKGVASAKSSMRNACYCCFGVSAGPWCFPELNRTAKPIINTSHRCCS